MKKQHANTGTNTGADTNTFVAIKKALEGAGDRYQDGRLVHLDQIRFKEFNIKKIRTSIRLLEDDLRLLRTASMRIDVVAITHPVIACKLVKNLILVKNLTNYKIEQLKVQLVRQEELLQYHRAALGSR